MASFDAGKTEISIVSWNVHMGLHNDGGRNRIVEICSGFDADVLILQEAWWYGEQSSDLTASVGEALGASVFEVVSPYEMRRYPARWTVAVITNLAATRLADSEMPGAWSAGGSARRDRPMVTVRLEDSGLVVAGAHLDGIHALRRNPVAWQRQRRAFARAAGSVDVLAGDLNMWGPIVARDARPLKRAVRGRTWPAWRPHSQIDHLLVSDRVEVVHSEVLPNLGSDHRPIKAILVPTRVAANG